MPPISDSSAVGIIVAHANIGMALLRKNIGIWVSRDGGYTWKKQNKVLSYSILKLDNTGIKHWVKKYFIEGYSAIYYNIHVV